VAVRSEIVFACYKATPFIPMTRAFLSFAWQLGRPCSLATTALLFCKGASWNLLLDRSKSLHTPSRPRDGRHAMDNSFRLTRTRHCFALLGTNFGGDGRTTFALPNLQGKEPCSGLHYFIAINGIFPSRD